MRPVKFRKLMEGIHTKKGPYQVSLSPQVSCQCELQFWKEEQICKLGSGISYLTLLQSFQDSFDLPEEILGKKSAQIAISKDNKYCLKNISQDDFNTLNRIFNLYSEIRIDEPECILVPIYGVVVLYTIHKNNKVRSDPFMIMPNIQPYNTVFFDIKGHCDNRVIPSSDFKDFHFGKDQNFIKSKHREMLKGASQEFKNKFINRIQKTVHFLRKQSIIDYSLALAFKQVTNSINNQDIKWEPLNESYLISYSIIDYLQVFNQRKKLENRFKSLFFKQVSSVDPSTYAQRLLDFIKKAIY